MKRLKYTLSFIEVFFLFFVFLNSSIAGFGQPISKFDCPKCKCTLEDPCTYEEIKSYQLNGVSLTPVVHNSVMCDMDIFDIDLDLFLKKNIEN
jgi:hypothetical protein